MIADKNSFSFSVKTSCTVDELCSGGIQSKKVKEFPPQPGLELMTSGLEVWCYINWATEASKWYKQNLDYIIFMHFSVKILKRKWNFRFFRYRYGLVQKIKNVLTYYEYIFDFLKNFVPITEIPEIPFPFQHFHWKMPVPFGCLCSSVDIASDF